MNNRTPATESIREPFDPSKAIDWENFNQKISNYFTVGEVLNRDLRRIPDNSDVLGNIYALADELDKMREEWGSAVGVTSWYRPPAINRAVGGVSNSQHLYGAAVDVYTFDGQDAEFEKFLNAHWGGALGYGIESGRGFTHLDLREGGWRRGPKAIRWWY